MKVKVLAFADFPSPYRVEVFKGLAKSMKYLPCSIKCQIKIEMLNGFVRIRG